MIEGGIRSFTFGDVLGTWDSGSGPETERADDSDTDSSKLVAEVTTCSTPLNVNMIIALSNRNLAFVDSRHTCFQSAIDAMQDEWSSKPIQFLNIRLDDWSVEGNKKRYLLE
jgi:hypothetical protein